MLITKGTQERLLAEAPAQAGSISKEGSINSDSLLATLWVNSLPSGTLSVSVYTLTDTGKEDLLIAFPVVSGPTVNLLLKKAAISLQRFRVQVDYTGACDYEIYVRAVEGAGESSARILGSDALVTSAATVTSVAAPLIPATLTDRTGLVIKNWGTSANVFLSEDALKLPSQGYPIGPKDALALDVSAGVTIYAISDGVDVDIRIAQAGGG